MKLVICGLWHVHAEAYFLKASNDSEILGAWDPDPERLGAFCQKHGVKPFRSLDELLQSGADGAIVCTSSDTHADVMVKIAEAGMDIFTEKVLALSTAECERIEKAVQKAGVRFVISFPHKSRGGILAVKKLVDNGELGKINYCRIRNVHSGSTADWLPVHFFNKKECGGGAMIDLGAHGMYLIDWILGIPQAAASMFTVADNNPKNTDGVEDNAVTVFRYENGAIAVNETGFDSPGYPLTLEVCGEKGWVRFDGSVTTKCAEGDPAPVEVPPEEDLPQPITQFAKGLPIEGCGMEEAKRLTLLMEMAYKEIR